MKRNWHPSEKWLLLTPLLVLGAYWYWTFDSRSTLRHPTYVLSLAFSPDGKTLATGGGDTLIRQWNVEDGTLTSTLDSRKNDVASVVFSPNGRLIASATVGTISGTSKPLPPQGDLRVWECNKSVPLWILNNNNQLGGKTLAFSPNSRVLASAGDCINLWDTGNGRLLRTLGKTQTFYSLDYSPDGSAIATLGGDGNIRLWNPATGKNTITLSYPQQWIRLVVFSPDGRFIAAGGDDGPRGGEMRWTIKIWSARTGLLVRTINAHTSSIDALAFSPSGQILASGSIDSQVKLWDMKSYKLLRTLSHPDAVGAIAFSPNAWTLATACRDGKVRLWDVSGK